MQKKKGISLIVLVITIIVMIILAAAVIISLNNSGIIEKASTAVQEHNLDEVNHIAQVAWSEAYLNGAKTQGEFETAVTQALSNNNVDTTKYDITVTTSGVTVNKKGSSNETNETNEVEGMVNFTINGTAFSVPENTTWADFLDSEANTLHLKPDTDNVFESNDYFTPATVITSDASNIVLGIYGWTQYEVIDGYAWNESYCPFGTSSIIQNGDVYGYGDYVDEWYSNNPHP